MVVSFFVLAIIVFNVSEIAFALTPQSLQSEPLIPGPLELGMVGITSTQTARLNIVQIPVDPDSPSTSPCAVVLNFYDSSGNLLKSKNVANLSDGQAAYLDLNGNALILNNTTAFTNGRAEIRAEVANLLDFLLPPDPSRCVVSLEVFDTATGATSVLWSHPPMPTLSTSSNDIQQSALDTKLSGNDTTAITTMAAATTPSPKISVSPMSVNLGSVKTGSESNPKTVTIKNTGNGDLIINSVTITGANQSEFNQINSCSTIPAKSSCPISVTFTPMPPFVKKAAIMSISSSDPKKSTLNVTLSGQAAPPKITVSPTSVNFGSVAVDTASAPKIVTIKNTGTSDLTVNAITIAGTNAAEFGQTNACSIIAKGSSCAITVTLSPTSAGSKTASIGISTNDPKKLVVNVKLSGKGSGGSTPSAVDITGNWNAYHTQTGTPEQGPELFTLTQTGNSMSGTMAEGYQITGSMSGLNITMSWTNKDGATTTLTGTVSANGTTMSGTWADTKGKSGTWRATKAQPAAVDITGNWNVYHTENGTEKGPDLTPLTQTGNGIAGTVSGFPITGTISGLNIGLYWTSDSGTITTLTGTVSANGTTMSGTWADTKGKSGTWRATKIS